MYSVTYLRLALKFVVCIYLGDFWGIYSVTQTPNLTSRTRHWSVATATTNDNNALSPSQTVHTPVCSRLERRKPCSLLNLWVTSQQTRVYLRKVRANSGQQKTRVLRIQYNGIQARATVSWDRWKPICKLHYVQVSTKKISLNYSRRGKQNQQLTLKSHRKIDQYGLKFLPCYGTYPSAARPRSGGSKSPLVWSRHLVQHDTVMMSSSH